VVVLHGCVYNDTVAVLMCETPGTLSGPGILAGTIVEGLGFGRAPGDPVHGVDIKLGVTGTPNIVASTTTDNNGNYSFGNVPLGDYTIYADIPGLERDSSYVITLDAINNQFLDLNYLVDSSTIYILPNIGIENVSPEEIGFAVFPNPVTDQSIIKFNIEKDTDGKLEVFDLLGVKIQTIVSADLNSGEYYYNFAPINNNLKPGVYFISLTAEGKTSTVRIVVIR